MALDTSRAVATLRGLTAKFDLGMSSAAPFYPQVCTQVPSTGADEKYGFLGAMPGVREWLDDRVFHGLRAGDYTIANKEWENSIKIEKNDIDDDRLNMYGPVLENMGQEAAHHPDELLYSTIVAGETTACFDGQYFFDTDHAWGDSGSQSNDLTYDATSHTAVTSAEMKLAIRAAVRKMLSFKNDKGKYLHRPTISRLSDLVVLVPLGLRDQTYDAIEAQLVSGGDTNVVIDRPQIVATAQLTDDTKFYLFRVGQPLKPFVFQARRPLARQMKGMDDREFKDVKFMTDARYNLGYLAWWNAVLTTFN